MSTRCLFSTEPMSRQEEGLGVQALSMDSVPFQGSTQLSSFLLPTDGTCDCIPLARHGFNLVGPLPTHALSGSVRDKGSWMLYDLGSVTSKESFVLRKNLFFLSTCMNACLHVCMSVHHGHVWCPQGPKSIGSPKT